MQDQTGKQTKIWTSQNSINGDGKGIVYVEEGT